MAQLADKTRCLDDNTIAELLEGRLSQPHLTKVEVHADSCSACRRLLAELAADPIVERPTRAIGDNEPTKEAAQLVAEPVPRILESATMVDHFRIGKLIGTGGMGQVYSARDTKLGRKVALKMVLPRLVTSDEAIERFQLEARTTARFSHPNIVTIHFVGAFHGRPYVALEYLRGCNLRDLMLEARPPVHRAVAISRDIARALAEAHRHGVLHRDLKPANVHIAVDGHVRVLDFGLAKIIDAEAPPPSSTRLWGDEELDMLRTHFTGLAGTPNYMAPEQWSAEPCSTATDVWALGVVMFQLFTSRRAFDAQSQDELALAVCGVVDAPRVEQYVDDVPVEIANLVAACLRKKPANRPSVAEIIEVLDAFEPTTPPPRASSPPSAKRTSPRRAAIVGLSALLLLGLTMASSFGRSERPELLATVMSDVGPLGSVGQASASTKPLSTSSKAAPETASTLLSSNAPLTSAAASTTKHGSPVLRLPAASASPHTSGAPVASSDPTNPPSFDGARK